MTTAVPALSSFLTGCSGRKARSDRASPLPSPACPLPRSLPPSRALHWFSFCSLPPAPHPCRKDVDFLANSVARRACPLCSPGRALGPQQARGTQSSFQVFSHRSFIPAHRHLTKVHMWKQVPSLPQPGLRSSSAPTGEHRPCSLTVYTVRAYTHADLEISSLASSKHECLKQWIS